MTVPSHKLAGEGQEEERKRIEVNNIPRGYAQIRTADTGACAGEDGHGGRTAMGDGYWRGKRCGDREIALVPGYWNGKAFPGHGVGATSQRG